MENIWFKDVKHLFTENNFNKFIPSKDMTFAEQLNTLVRLSIYFSILVYILKKDTIIFMIPIFTCVFTYFIYSIDTQNKTNEHMFLDNKNLVKDIHTDEICKKPTENNPFMNVLMNEYVQDPERKQACNISNTAIRNQSQKFFDRKLYRSVGDIFNREASDRQFITNPITTIPNDQQSFGEFLYGKMKNTCKENNGNRCYANTYRPINS